MLKGEQGVVQRANIQQAVPTHVECLEVLFHQRGALNGGYAPPHVRRRLGNLRTDVSWWQAVPEPVALETRPHKVELSQRRF